MTQVATTPATITVAICTRDRPDYLRECLAGLRCQTVPAPVLVVDSGSGDVAADRIRALVDVFAGAQLVRVDRAGLSVARNAALAAVGDGYVAFLDDDAVPAPDFVASVRSAVRAAPRPPALLGGRVLPQWEAPLPDWWPDRLRGVLSLIDAGIIPLVPPLGFERSGRMLRVNSATVAVQVASALGAAKLLFVGAGPKGASPLIFTLNGTPYRGFLEGRVDGDGYRLILHCSNLELKAVSA